MALGARTTLVVRPVSLLLAGLFLSGCGQRTQPEGPITVTLVPLGKASEKEVEAVRRAVKRTYRANVSVAERKALPKSAYYPPRKRYRADRVIAWLEPQGTTQKVLGIAKADVSVPMRGHADWGVGGFAGFGKRAAVASSFRVRGDLACLGQVAVHELGHTLGRPHCPTAGCTMHDGEGKLPVGKSRIWFCNLCRRQLGQWLR